MSVHPRVVHKRRETITALPLYHSGHLLKKQAKDKNFKKYFGELRGSTLFLYKDEKEHTYMEKLDLQQVESMETEPPSAKKTSSIFNLNLNSDKVQLKMDGDVTGEEWKGFIFTVVKNEIPSDLKLLPGQRVKLQDVLNQERRRNSPLPKPPLPERPAFLQSELDAGSASAKPGFPVCFYNVNRQEAVRMLNTNPECGGIIIRPSTVGTDYAVTLRQTSPSGASIKNYRLSSTDSGFVIKLDPAVTVPSLHAVLEYFLEKTEYQLQPYVVSQPYDTHLEASPAQKNAPLPKPLPKTVPKAQVAPMQREPPPGDVRPPPPGSSAYMIPDEVKLKKPAVRPVHLDEELRQILKIRREMIYSATEGHHGYESHISDRSSAQGTPRNAPH